MEAYVPTPLTPDAEEWVVRRDQAAHNHAGAYQFIECETANVEWVFPPEDLIHSDLQLVFGIGSATAGKLKAEGYETLSDLCRHPRWAAAARELLRIIERRDVGRLEKYGASDLELLSFYRPEDLTFIDIETAGLYYMYPVFLIGMLRFEQGKGIIRQFLARNFEEEIAILSELNETVRNRGILVSYNGKSFDIPYLRGRLRYYQLDDRFEAFHLDLLKHARREFKPVLPNCRLTTIEKYIFNENREGDLPGSEVPEFYQRFMDTGQRFYIDPILQHNARDLLALAKLLGILVPGGGGKTAACI